MNEKFAKAVRECLTPILSRFANGIAITKIEEKKSFNGTEYYDVETNNIPMTPCVFKTLCIQGEGKKYKDEEGNEYIHWSLSWRWTYFDGGSNGANLITITTSADVQYGRLNVGNIYFY